MIIIKDRISSKISNFHIESKKNNNNVFVNNLSNKTRLNMENNFNKSKNNTISNNNEPENLSMSIIDIKNKIKEGIKQISGKIKERLDQNPYLSQISGIKLTDIKNTKELSSTYEIELKNGLKYIFNKDTKKLIYKLDEDGDVVYSLKLNSIFDDNNISKSQYGATQMSFRNNNANLLKDKNIKKILKENFPNASEEDYSLLLYKLCNVGCHYTALINTIFKQYEGKEQEFKNLFGFGMYKLDNNLNVTYNYEPLILKFFIAYNKEAKKFKTIQDIYGNVKDESEDEAISGEENSTGAKGLLLGEAANFAVWLNKTYNLNEVNINYTLDPLTKEKYNKSIEKGKHIIITAEDFDLYNIDRNTGERKNIYESDIGKHAMYVTGFTDKGDIVVSSWGNKYIIDLSNAKNMAYETVDYNGFTSSTDDYFTIDPIF